MDLPRQLYREILWHLQHYNDDKDTLERLRLEAIEHTPDYTQPHVRTGPGDPVGQAVVTIDGRTRDLERWISTVEAVRTHYAMSHKAEYYHMVFDCAVDPRIAATHLALGCTTAYAWRNDIIGYTAILAAQNGALRLEE